MRIRMVFEETSDGAILFYRQFLATFFKIFFKNNILCYYRVADGADPTRLTSEPHNWVQYLRVPAENRAVTL
jgi:hypothetical protein